MTREDAYYLKHLLLSDFREVYEEALNGFLEAEEPINDITLKLVFWVRIRKKRFTSWAATVRRNPLTKMQPVISSACF